MSETALPLDLDKINEHITERSNVFYWQTDRAVEPAEAGQIWADRHRYFTDEELLARANEVLSDDKLAMIEPFDSTAQTNLGNVNSVRVGRLDSGKEVVIRCHPKGIRNGYFHTEAAASHQAKQAGLPAYDTLAIHDFAAGDDFAFQVIEKLTGTAIAKFLEAEPDAEDRLLLNVGRMMARLHQINVTGFGPFDNERARHGELVGLHATFGEAVCAALPFNLSVLEKQSILNSQQSQAITKLFASNKLLDVERAVLIHNDFADWNLLTDGQAVTGILDWDECVAGDPIADIACWSTFFEPGRLGKFLEGYWQVADKPDDFQEKFELLRLRYVISKMTLRTRRYSWVPSESVKQKIETGKTHLAASLTYFGI